jgi:hypothetical protein
VDSDTGRFLPLLPLAVPLPRFAAPTTALLLPPVLLLLHSQHHGRHGYGCRLRLPSTTMTTTTTTKKMPQGGQDDGGRKCAMFAWQAQRLVPPSTWTSICVSASVCAASPAPACLSVLAEWPARGNAFAAVCVRGKDGKQMYVSDGVDDRVGGGRQSTRKIDSTQETVSTTTIPRPSSRGTFGSNCADSEIAKYRSSCRRVCARRVCLSPAPVLPHR